MKDVELKPITTEELLNKFDQWSDERLNWNYDKYAHERALWQMLKINEEHIKGLIEEDPTGHWFHKAFRQIDVIPTPNNIDKACNDMVVYLLLRKSNLFWDVIAHLNGSNVDEFDCE
jgi:hypothetical protein